MLNQIAEIIELAVNRTNLVEQYDGVVKRITDKGETFPVSCTDPTACDNNRYRKAVPNQSLRGLAYVEQRGAAAVGDFQSWGYSISYPIRLVVWINLGIQSETNCSNIMAQAELNIINCLKLRKSIVTDFTSKNVSVDVRNIQLVNKSPGDIFSGLAYDGKSALYLWPYAYTAIDLNIIFQIPANCVLPIEPTVAEQCVEY